MTDISKFKLDDENLLRIAQVMTVAREILSCEKTHSHLRGIHLFANAASECFCAWYPESVAISALSGRADLPQYAHDFLEGIKPIVGDQGWNATTNIVVGAFIALQSEMYKSGLKGGCVFLVPPGIQAPWG